MTSLDVERRETQSTGHTKQICGTNSRDAKTQIMCIKTKQQLKPKKHVHFNTSVIVHRMNGVNSSWFQVSTKGMPSTLFYAVCHMVLIFLGNPSGRGLSKVPEITPG